jgi:uncharacterized protein YybS (DUF2232 family)
MVAETLLAALVAVGLMASGNLLPVLGVFLSLLSPLPFVLLRLRHGLPALWLALALTALTLAGLSSGIQGVAFLLEFGIPAMILAEGLRRGSRPELLVTTVAVLLTLGGMGVLILTSGDWSHPLSAIGRHGEDILAQMEAFGAQLGVPGDGAGVLAGSPTFPAFLRLAFRVAFPALSFVGSLLTAGGYLVLLQALTRQWTAQLGGVRPEPLRWELPEVLVWAFIAGGGLYLTGLPRLQAVGLNLLIILVGLYFLQGLSIAAFLFQRFQLPRVLAALSVFLLLFHPVFPLLVAGVGLFDVWFGFRHLSFPKSPRQT